MLGKARIVCFSATKDSRTAREVYESVLGMSLIEDSPFALVLDASGTMLRIQKVPDHTPAKHTSLGWEVNDIRSTIHALHDKGVRFEHYERLQQDQLGVWKSPSGAQVAWFRDPDGNILSLTQGPS